MGRASMPAELRQLLHMVDGRRTREELIGALHKSALTAGGLRWLEASGYIESTELPADSRLAASVPAPAFAPQRAVTAPRPIHPRERGKAQVVRAALAQHMLYAIGRWLGDDCEQHRRQVESAESMDQLLRCLNPLTDAIVAHAGAQSGAEFAEDAAAILER